MTRTPLKPGDWVWDTDEYSVGQVICEDPSEDPDSWYYVAHRSSDSNFEDICHKDNLVPITDLISKLMFLAANEEFKRFVEDRREAIPREHDDSDDYGSQDE